MSKRPTPRTDSAIMEIPSKFGSICVVRVELALDLERELGEALDDLQVLRSNKMRPTQETDAEYKEANDYEPSAFVEPLAKFLAVERERDEARAERDILRSNKMSDPLLETTFKHLNRERDEACQVANGLAKQVERLRKERDQLKEALLIMENLLKPGVELFPEIGEILKRGGAK